MPEKHFEPIKSLLNPFFESYKLQSDVLSIEEQVVFKKEIAPIGRVLSGGDSEARLGWREAKSRAAWNHLTVSLDAKEAAFIDQDAVVWLAKWSSNVSISCDQTATRAERKRSHRTIDRISHSSSLYLNLLAEARQPSSILL